MSDSDTAHDRRESMATIMKSAFLNILFTIMPVMNLQIKKYFYFSCFGSILYCCVHQGSLCSLFKPFNDGNEKSFRMTL